MCGVGIESNMLTYNAAILACKKGGHWEKSLSLLEIIPGMGIKMGVITYNSAIKMNLISRN